VVPAVYCGSRETKSSHPVNFASRWSKRLQGSPCNVSGGREKSRQQKAALKIFAASW
jgi:hypothetical protein